MKNQIQIKNNKSFYWTNPETTKQSTYASTISQMMWWILSFVTICCTKIFASLMKVGAISLFLLFDNAEIGILLLIDSN